MNTAATLSVTEEVPTVGDLTAYPAISALHNSRYFAGLSKAVLARLAANACIRSFGPGQEIGLEGRWRGAAVLVVRGCISAVRRTGRELTLETFRGGDALVDVLLCPDTGLPSRAGNAPALGTCAGRPATPSGLRPPPSPAADPRGRAGETFQGSHFFEDRLIAGETTVLLLLPREDFLSVARMVPEVALALAREFERRLTCVKALAWSLATTDVENRLFSLIASLAQAQGEVSEEGTVIKHFPTQRDLACRIGACRETVCRIVSDLSRKNLLLLRGRRLTVSPQFFALARASEVG